MRPARLVTAAWVSLTLALSLGAARAHAPHDPILALALSPDFAHDRTLFVAVQGFSLLLRSTDGGTSFEPVHSGLEQTLIRDLAVSPFFARDRTVFCTDGRVVSVSRDAGELWAPRALPADAGPVTALAVVPDADGGVTLLAGTRDAGVLSSSDTDASWTAVAGAAAGPVLALAVSPATIGTRRVVALLAPHHVLVSDDGGAHFEVRPSSGPGPGADTDLSCADVDVTGTIRVGTRDGRIWRSDDGGASWAQTAHLDGGAVTSIETARAADGRPLVLATTEAGGAFRRVADEPWTRARAGLREPSGQSSVHFLTVRASPAYAEDTTLFLGTFEGLYTGDGERPWRYLRTLPPTLVRNLGVSPSFGDDGRVWVSSYGLGLLASEDRGASWRRLEIGAWRWPDAVGASPAFEDDGTLIVGTPNRQLMSRTHGLRWRTTIDRRGGFAKLVAFAPDYATSGRIWVQLVDFESTSENAFLRSADRGESWTPVGPGTVEGLCFDPDDDTGRLYLAASDGLHVGDATFERLEAPLAHPTDVAAAPGPDGLDRLLLCAPTDGAFLSEDGGASWRRCTGAIERVNPLFVAISPEFARDGVAFCGTRTGVLVTRDGGRSWTAGAGPRCVFALHASPDFARDRTLFAAGYAGPWRSDDAGASWTLLDPFAGWSR